MTSFASEYRSTLVLLNALFVGQLYGDKLLALRVRKLIFFATDLQTVNITQQITARADLFINPLSAKRFSYGSNCLHCPVTALYFGAKLS